MLDWLRTQELNYLDLWIPFECVAKTKTFSITIQEGREGLNSKDPFFHWIITMMMMMVGPALPSRPVTTQEAKTCSWSLT